MLMIEKANKALWLNLLNCLVFGGTSIFVHCTQFCTVTDDPVSCRK